MIEKHRAVQAVAKQVLAGLAPTLGPDDTEFTIATRATAMMADMGITQTWYYACPALVLLGSRSCLSISGSRYEPASERVGYTNLVTVDLRPSKAGVWGDCARSFFVEEGTVVAEPRSDEFRRGKEAERELHDAMVAFVTPETTFQDLFDDSNRRIAELGFENLDFLGNLGHTIESAREDRRYIENGNRLRLSNARLFTFEPHIRAPDGRWGFKHENIYSFRKDGRVEEL